ncbi:hypothetical protein [Actinocrispum wychmicini]|uniref:Uncharacterized protein n=1 Tax=Actinocrispum wychmicini TaxID=1213861 RepID=A0A4R2J1X6_9PSEU|nr:hypothetical protein [Actinocrispum wychmicini]TCO50798.1 hypothetical protein EV192_113178 [Actinocrispum wychmicini]
MDHDALVRTAEPVVYFGDMKLFGQHPVKGLSVLWHERERRWLVALPGYAGGVTRPETLRRFAEGALAALDQDQGEDEVTVFGDDRVSVDTMTGVDEDGPYLTIWAWFDHRQDFVGVSAAGEPLYRNEAGTSCVEFHLNPPDAEPLRSAFRTLLHRLATAGPASADMPQSANVITTFANRANESNAARLDIARRPGDNQWLVTLNPRLSRPATEEAIRAFAEATQHILDTREGERVVTLLREPGYRMDVAVGIEATAFHVTATVRSPSKDGTGHVLNLDAHFAPVSETHLREMLKGMR